jgi:hypothetical protein
VFLQALTMNIASGTINVLGGNGGSGGFMGTSPPQYVSLGGTGGDGWIRLETTTGTVIGSGSATIQPNTGPAYSVGFINVFPTQGQSRFFDTGTEDPDWIGNGGVGGGLTVNLTLNSGTIQVYAQGAEVGGGNVPDPQTYWPNNLFNTNPGWTLIYDSTGPGYTGNIHQLDRYRFLRFRIVFGNLLNAFPPGPVVTDITFPHRG